MDEADDEPQRPSRWPLVLIVVLLGVIAWLVLRDSPESVAIERVCREGRLADVRWSYACHIRGEDLACALNALCER